MPPYKANSQTVSDVSGMFKFVGGLDNAIQEMQGYIDNVVRKSGKPFEYAPPRTSLTHMDIYRRTVGIDDGTSCI